MEYEEKGRRNVDVQFETIKSEKVNFGRNNFLEVARKRAKTSDGTILQEVHIIDANGVAWEALYTLEPQPDGSLKISGCVLTKAVIS